MTYGVRDVRGQVVVIFFDDKGRVEREQMFDPDHADRFAECLTETAKKAREWTSDAAHYLADCNSE